MIEFINTSAAGTPFLIHIMMTGQSQVIGTSATPRLGHATDPHVLMLGSSPVISPSELDANIATWTFATCVENYSTVDTMSVAIGRDLLNKFQNKGAYRVCSTVCGNASTSFSNLMRGGSTGCYERLIAASARVKALCDASGWRYGVVFVVMGGGDAGTFTSNRLRIWYEDLLQDLPTHEFFYITYDQIRQRDFIGASWYDAGADMARVIQGTDTPITMYYRSRNYPLFDNDSNIIMSHPRSQVGRTGDDVHHTANQMRWNACLFAETIYRMHTKKELPSPLRLGTPTWDGTTITAPILGLEGGTPAGSGNYGISVWNITDDQEEPISATINGTDLDITFSSLTVGWKRLLVYGNFSEDIALYNNWAPWSSLDDTTLGEMHVSYTPDTLPLFNDTGTSNPYVLDKYMTSFIYPMYIEVYTGTDSTHVSHYVGSTSIDFVLEQNGVEKTAYIVGYTTEASRSAATVISDASGSGGSFRAVINNTADPDLDVEVTVNHNGTTQVIAAETTYYLHKVVQDTGPSTIEETDRSITTRFRQTDIIYFSDPRGWVKRFRLYVPNAYWKRKDPNTAWPWKIAYHGSGEQPSTNNPGTGEAYDSQSLIGFAAEIDTGMEYEDIVISPQWHEGSPNRDEAYHIIVNEVENWLGFNLEQGGLFFAWSQGGALPFTFADKYPERVACIITSAGFTRIDGTSGDGNEQWTFDIADKPERIWSIPIMMQHNAGDATVIVAQSTDVVNAVNALTGDIAAPVAAVHVDDGTGLHAGWVDICEHDNSTVYDYFQNVPNASNEEEFYHYHLANNYSFSQRIDEAIIAAETIGNFEYKDRAQEILNRNINNLPGATVTAYQARLDAINPAPDISASANPLDFGYWLTGDGPTSVFNLTITNSGTEPLTISSISLQTNPSSVFAIDSGGTPPAPLAAGATHVIGLTFDPSAEQHYDGVLRILSDSPGEETFDIALDGDGLIAFTEYWTIQGNVGESLATVSGWTNIDSPAKVTEANDEVVVAASNIDGEGVGLEYFAIGDSIWGFDASIDSSGDQGFNTDGTWPGLVLRDYVFTQGQGSSHEVGIRFTGLDDSRYYRLRLIGSRSGTGTRPTQHRILSTYTGSQGELTQSHNVMNNNTLSNYFIGLRPQSGVIEILQRNTSGTAFHYLNAFILEEYGP